jgi:Leucine Rich repeat
VGALKSNMTLKQLDLDGNCVSDEGAMAIADALKFNSTMHRLNLGCNCISDVGAMALFKALQHYNHTLTSLNLNGNEEISFILWGLVNFMLASRRALNAHLKCLPGPLEKQLMPLAISAVQGNCMRDETPELVHHHETGAGIIFYLVRATALNDSKVVKKLSPSCKEFRLDSVEVRRDATTTRW